MRKLKNAVIFILFLALFIMPVVLAADAPSPSQQVSLQQFTLIVQKQNADLQAAIIKNTDDDFKQFDDRISAMLSSFLRKLIIGMLGGMTVVLIGYAAIVTYVTNKFTPSFQRNVFKQKNAQAISQGRIVPAPERVPTPIVVQKQNQTSNLKSKPAPLSTYTSDADEPQFSQVSLGKQPEAQDAPVFVKEKMFWKIVGFGMLIILGVAIVLVVGYYMYTRYKGSVM